VVWNDEKGLWLADMAGNVYEWCRDWLDVEYDKESFFYSKTAGSKDPLNDGSVQWGKVGNQEYRVLRGGSWSDYPQHLRGAARNWDDPVLRNYFIGFRCVSSRY
jgi:formylglycine-generating enzyme required for sulfatase activity